MISRTIFDSCLLFLTTELYGLSVDGDRIVVGLSHGVAATVDSGAGAHAECPLLEGIAAGVVIVDNEDHVLSCNQRGAELWRLPQDGVAAKGVRAASFLIDDLD